MFSAVRAQVKQNNYGRNDGKRRILIRRRTIKVGSNKVQSHVLAEFDDLKAFGSQKHI